MTTISSASATPITTATASTSPAPAVKKPYDGAAAVAKAKEQAATAIAAQENSFLNKNLADLPNKIIDLLQGGGTGSDYNALFNSNKKNPVTDLMNVSLAKKLMAATAYKRGQVTPATSSVDTLINKLIAANTTKTDTKA